MNKIRLTEVNEDFESEFCANCPYNGELSDCNRENRSCDAFNKFTAFADYLQEFENAISLGELIPVYGEWLEYYFSAYLPVEFDENSESKLHKCVGCHCLLCGRYQENKQPYCCCSAKMESKELMDSNQIFIVPINKEKPIKIVFENQKLEMDIHHLINQFSFYQLDELAGE